MALKSVTYRLEIEVIEELKKLIADLPDDMQVVTQSSKNTFHAVTEMWTETRTLHTYDERNPYEFFAYSVEEDGVELEAFVVNRE